MLLYKTFPSGLLGSNTHIVYDPESREAMVVDCGNDPTAPRLFLLENELKLKYILLTHGHYDHADFIEDYLASFPEATYAAHADEAVLLTDAYANVSIYFGTPKKYPLPTLALREGDTISLGKCELRVLSTPGHTPGSLCLYSKADKLMLTGDTLFKGGRGRTDLTFGDEEAIQHSLSRLLSMDEDITFLSGHGEASLIGNERGRIF